MLLILEGITNANSVKLGLYDFLQACTFQLCIIKKGHASDKNTL